MNTKIEVLQACTVAPIGFVVKMPDVKLDRKLYLEVAKALELIGGKWKGGNVQGFVFSIDPAELLEKIQGGDNVNLKKQYQFFETPYGLAKRLVELACIFAHNTVLEPSAGQGAIVKAILEECPNSYVDCFELMETNCMILNKIPRAFILEKDFLAATYVPTYDRIIANPPFSKNQDIQHVRKMVDCLKTGGRLVSVMSKHWITSENRVEKEFKTWLDQFDVEIIEVEAGTFKESGTNIAAVIVVINK
jgi:hypothetical protein